MKVFIGNSYIFGFLTALFLCNTTQAATVVYAWEDDSAASPPFNQTSPNEGTLIISGSIVDPLNFAVGEVASWELSFEYGPNINTNITCSSSETCAFGGPAASAGELTSFDSQSFLDTWEVTHRYANFGTTTPGLFVCTQESYFVMTAVGSMCLLSHSQPQHDFSFPLLAVWAGPSAKVSVASIAKR